MIIPFPDFYHLVSSKNNVIEAKSSEVIEGGKRLFLSPGGREYSEGEIRRSKIKPVHFYNKILKSPKHKTLPRSVI
jgi:hypothetical protein